MLQLCASFLHGQVNGLAHAPKLAVDLRVGKAQHLKPPGFQKPGSLRVVALSFGIVVLGAVQLQDQLGLGAVKVHNIRADGMLAAEANRVGAQVAKPKGIFFPGGVFSELLGIRGQVIFYLAPLCFPGWPSSDQAAE